MRRLVIGVLIVVLALAAGASIAAAAAPTMTIEPQSGPAGTRVSFTGSGFTPSGKVSVLLIEGLGLIISEQKAGPNGTISGSFIVPEPGKVAELTFGKVAVFAIDDVTGQQTNSAFFDITQGTLLPQAGGSANLLYIAVSGIVLVAAGAFLRSNTAMR